MVDYLVDPQSIPTPKRLDLGGETCYAFSKSAHYTYFVFKKKRVAFDLGFCPEQAIGCDHVFISHAHEDHSWGVIRHMQYRRLFKLPPATYYFPNKLVDSFRDVVRAWHEFNRRKDPVFPVIKGLQFEEEVFLSRDVRIQAFETHHRGENLGYHWFKSQSLHPFFSFLGDHTQQSLRQNPLLGHAQVLALELTFLLEDQSRAKAYQHMHLDDFKMLLEEGFFQNEWVVLKHLSSKYSRREIQAVLDSVLNKVKHPQFIVI